MTNPLHTLRDALADARGSHAVLARGIQPCDDPGCNVCILNAALTRAESALRELEAEPRYTVGQFFDALDAELELDKLDPLLQAYKDAIKRRLAERGEK